MFSFMKKKLKPGDVRGDEICCYIFGVSGLDGEEDVYLSLATSKQQLMADILEVFDDIRDDYTAKINGGNPYELSTDENINSLMWDGVISRFRVNLEKLKAFRSRLEENIDEHIAKNLSNNFFVLDEQNSFFLFVGMRARQKIHGQYIE
ncbi:TPA: hypothetical protein L9K99_005164 [Klebsiella quasipneumoniae subsp. similipneumoniae]|nr:hypothetical protein [Klebsiella quasipneumoniae subsp. similipneumoniae]